MKVLKKMRLEIMKISKFLFNFLKNKKLFQCFHEKNTDYRKESIKRRSINIQKKASKNNKELAMF